MDSPIMIDLNVNRDLLNVNFDCYRVSISPIVTYCQPIDKSVAELKLSDDDYSYLHVSMASHFNHLFNDPFCAKSVFFVSRFGQVFSATIELTSGKLTKPQLVYSIPEYSSSLVTISFPDNELAIISDSNQSSPCIYLLSTPSRSASQPWTLMSTISLTDPAFNLKTPFQLVCSQSTNLYNTCTQIDFILCYIDKRSKDRNHLDKSSIESSFISVLNWFTISGNGNESDSWTVKRTRRLVGSDWPKYVSFDFIGSPMLCVVSEKDFTFVYDSEKPINQLNIKSNSGTDDKLFYTYYQSLEDVSVTFKLPVDVSKSDIFVDFKPSKLTVKIKGEIQLEGDLCHMIDVNSSTWTLQQQQDYQLLELTVGKSDQGRVWKEFITGDKNCMEIVNHDMLEEIQQKLSFLTNDTQSVESESVAEHMYNPMGLEECDYVETSLIFSRFNGNTHLISHQINLSGNQWLFMIPTKKSSNAENNELPYFVVRHDVDALVWAPESSPDLNQFRVTHLATFPAIGYVQASKTNTRFIISPNNFNFVAIADGSRHIYVYKQPHSIQSEVRNRKTGKELQTVASQHVINLSDCQSIIGIHAVNDSIFVLSNDKIFLIKL